MFVKNKLIFNFKDNSLDLCLAAVKRKTIYLKAVETLDLNSMPQKEYAFNNSKAISQTRSFIRANGKHIKKVTINLSTDGIIIRVIETPLMNKSDLESFIENNKTSYFTVNMEDYVLDYKVLSIKNDTTKKMNLLIAIVPKYHLQEIISFVNSCNLAIENISIYPASIANLFTDYENNSIAILDANDFKSYITILSDNKLFLYSTMNSDLATYPLYDAVSTKNIDYEDLIDNLEYFLNFYSTRHFGNKVNNLYITGKYYCDPAMQLALKGRFDINIISGINGTDAIVKCHNSVNFNNYWSIIGCILSRKDILNKSLNFYTALTKNKEEKKDNKFSKLVASIVLFSLFVPVLFSAYCTALSKKYDLSSINQSLSSYTKVTADLADLNKFRVDNTKKSTTISLIKGTQLDSLYYINTIRGILPSQATIETIIVTQNSLQLLLRTNGDPLLKANLVTNINNLGIFQPIEVDTVSLDSSNKIISYKLIIKPH